MNLYTVIFEDNSVTFGGTIEEPKWLEIPEKKIRTIFYYLPLGDCLGVSGYDKYYHYIECCEDLNGEKKGIRQLEFANLICKKDQQYKLYKINLKTGQLEIKLLEENNELIKQLNPIGWK